MCVTVCFMLHTNCTAAHYRRVLHGTCRTYVTKCVVARRLFDAYALLDKPYVSLKLLSHVRSNLVRKLSLTIIIGSKLLRHNVGVHYENLFVLHMSLCFLRLNSAEKKRSLWLILYIFLNFPMFLFMFFQLQLVANL